MSTHRFRGFIAASAAVFLALTALAAVSVVPARALDCYPPGSCGGSADYTVTKVTVGSYGAASISKAPGASNNYNTSLTTTKDVIGNKVAVEAVGTAVTVTAVNGQSSAQAISNGTISVPEGGGIIVELANFKTGEPVNVFLNPAGTLIGRLTVGAGGTAYALLPLPGTAINGLNTLQVIGVRKSDSDRVQVLLGIRVRLNVQVDPTPTPTPTTSSPTPSPSTSTASPTPSPSTSSPTPSPSTSTASPTPSPTETPTTTYTETPVVDVPVGTTTALSCDATGTCAPVEVKTTTTETAVVLSVGTGVTLQLSSTSTSGSSLQVAPDGTLVIPAEGGISIVLSGLTPGTYVDVYLNSDRIFVGKAKVGPDGTVNATLPLPSGVPVGDHTAQLIATDYTGKVVSVALGVLVRGKVPAGASRFAITKVVPATNAKLKQGTRITLRAGLFSVGAGAAASATTTGKLAKCTTRVSVKSAAGRTLLGSTCMTYSKKDGKAELNWTVPKTYKGKATVTFTFKETGRAANTYNRVVTIG